MVGGPTLKARTEYISALIPPPLSSKHEQFESGYGSTNSTSDESSKHQRIQTARSQKHHRLTSATTDRLSTKQQQQQLQQLNLDPISNYRRLKTANSRISIDTALPIHKVIRVSNNFIYFILNFI